MSLNNTLNDLSALHLSDNILKLSNEKDRETLAISLSNTTIIQPGILSAPKHKSQKDHIIIINTSEQDIILHPFRVGLEKEE